MEHYLDMNKTLDYKLTNEKLRKNFKYYPLNESSTI